MLEYVLGGIVAIVIISGFGTAFVNYFSVRTDALFQKEKVSRIHLHRG